MRGICCGSLTHGDQGVGVPSLDLRFVSDDIQQLDPLTLTLSPEDGGEGTRNWPPVSDGIRPVFALALKLHCARGRH